MKIHKQLRTGNTIWSSNKMVLGLYNTPKVLRILPPEHNPISAERWLLWRTMKIKKLSLIILEWLYLNFKKEADKYPSEWKINPIYNKNFNNWILLSWSLSSVFHLFSFRDFWTNLVTEIKYRAYLILLFHFITLHRCVSFLIEGKTC